MAAGFSAAGAGAAFSAVGAAGLAAGCAAGFGAAAAGFGVAGFDEGAAAGAVVAAGVAGFTLDVMAVFTVKADRMLTAQMKMASDHVAFSMKSVVLR